MKKRNLFHAFLIASFCGSLLVGCASGEKADIPATADPKEEIRKLDSDLNTAISKNVDVLATTEFKKSRNDLDKAKSAIEHGKPQSDVLDYLREGKGALQAGYRTSQNREGKAEGLFAARQRALRAGVTSHSELQKDFDKLDSEVSDKADDLANTKIEKLTDFQNRYVELERRSVVLTQLGKAQAMVNGAEKDKAEKKAPVSFKKAELSLKTAESMISSNVQNPSGFQASVAQANADAQQLLDVMTAIQQNGKNLPEPVAIKIVAQNKTISGLKTNLDTVTEKNAETQADMQSSLQEKNEKLADASSKVQLQQVIDKARQQFNADEAEAYQQGNKLVIRLKKLNFASGRADLPPASLALLAKVSEVAGTLKPSEIVVQGHTDSVGTEVENKRISEKRASAVATYLKTNGFNETKIESEGYGFEKPIASNKSKEGRAQNRRVDVIITPETIEK